MKIKSLLAAVSMVALTAGTASALSIPSVAPVAPATIPANAAVMTPVELPLANELMLPATFPAGSDSVAFSIVTDSGDYPSGNNFLVDIFLPNGVEVDGPIDGTILTFPTDGSAVVQSQSGSTLELLVSIPQDVAVDTLNFEIPLALTSCDVTGRIRTTVTTEGGTPVEDGVAGAPSPLAPCESAFDTTFAPDAQDTVIGLIDYEQLKDVPGGALTLTSTIGLYSALIDTDVAVDLDGTALTPASIDEITFDICLEDGSEVDGITVDGVAGVASADGNTYSFTMPFAADVTDADIVITVTGDNPIPSQPVIVKNVIHDFTDAGGPDLIGTEAGAGGAIDALQREGQNFGFFDWNSGQAGAQTVSVYRITGLDPSSSTPWTISIENAGFGAPGTLTGSIASDAAGEAVLTSAAIAALLPAAVKRYDFGITLETGNDVDIDRLMSKGGVISAFNDGSNNSSFTLPGQPTGDSDNQFPNLAE